MSGGSIKSARPAAACCAAADQAALLRLWSARGITDLSTLHLVEVGCGTGGNLASRHGSSTIILERE